MNDRLQLESEIEKFKKLIQKKNLDRQIEENTRVKRKFDEIDLAVHSEILKKTGFLSKSSKKASIESH
jgi:chaperonin cofactor prefoldin